MKKFLIACTFLIAISTQAQQVIRQPKAMRFYVIDGYLNMRDSAALAPADRFPVANTYVRPYGASLIRVGIDNTSMFFTPAQFLNQSGSAYNSGSVGAAIASYLASIPTSGTGTGGQGPAGQDGKTILSGTTAPSSGIGSDGDFYLNRSTSTLYGPKASGVWPAGVSLIGPQGATGNTGLTGANGVDGKSILNGTTAPGSGIGTNGDFYINTASSTLYGPKSGGAWPTGISLVGPAGSGGSGGSADSTVFATRAYVNPRLSAVSSLTATYQPETIAFAQAHRLAGSSVDARQLTAVDRVIVGIKNAGFFAKIKDFMPFLGSNLSASLIKLVGTATATQTGFSETDYSQAGLDSSPLGVVNSTRYVDMGVDATTLGLAYNNIGLFVGLSDGGFGVRNSTTAAGSSGALIANYDAAVTDSRAFLLLNGASSIAGTSIGGPIAYVQGLSSGSGGVTAFRNGIQHATAVAGSNTLAVTGNFNLFRGKIGGTTFFLSERIGVSVITSSLTDAEGKTLSLLLLQYLRETGRILSNPFLVGFGDSITAGAGAQNPSAGGWVARLANKLGYTNLNTGIGSTTFRLSTAGFPGGYDRYPELYALPTNLMTIMYGTNDIGGDGNANGTSSTISDLFGKYQNMLTNLKRRVPRIIMVSPPYRNDANDTKMTAYVSSQANLAVAQGFPFVDAYNIFLDTGSPATYFPTGLHPNDLGAQVIADHVFAALQGRLYRDALLDFPSIAAGSSATMNVTMYTARAGQALSVTLPESVRSQGVQLSYWLSANDTVTIQLTNPTGAAIDPPSANYKTVVWLN